MVGQPGRSAHMRAVKSFTPRVTAGVHSGAAQSTRSLSPGERELSADELRQALRRSRSRTTVPLPENGYTGNVIARIDHERSRAPEHVIEYLADAFERGAPVEDLESVGVVVIERVR